jgi:hypothetical protein
MPKKRSANYKGNQNARMQEAKGVYTRVGAGAAGAAGADLVGYLHSYPARHGFRVPTQRRIRSPKSHASSHATLRMPYLTRHLRIHAASPDTMHTSFAAGLWRRER